MGSNHEFTIRNYYTRDIPIDDGFDGDAVASGETFPIRIRRFTVAQLQAFQRGFARVVSPSAERFIFRRAEGDEQAMRDDGKTHVIPHEEIERRRLEEMNTETRLAHDAASRADDEFMSTFCSDAIAANVSVAPGFTLKAQRGDTDETFQVQTGKDLVEAFGGNLSMLIRLTRAIHQENTLSPEAKKALRSLSGLTASSPTPAAVTGAGPTPAATATSAGPTGSVPSGPALVDPPPTPCGSDVLVSSS